MNERGEIDAEMLIAYADGELSPTQARRVERAIAADPSLRQRVDAHRKVRAMLANGIAPQVEGKVPDRLAPLLRPMPMVDLARRRPTRRWGTGLAIIASLFIGIVVGQLGENDAPVTAAGGTLLASGRLGHALDSQLASTQAPGSAIQIGMTFRDRQGAVCRSFTSTTLSGIACRQGAGWQLPVTRSDGDLGADIQAMAGGARFDPTAEAAAKAADWR
jgi:anti-sigma factor RsiW